MTLAKTVDDATPNPGDTITYTTVATNAGADGGTSIEIAELLPAGVTFVSASATQGSYDDGTGVWSIGSIASGDADTLSITATVDIVTAGSTITNTTSVASLDQREAPAGNSASASITVGVVLAISSAADQVFDIGAPPTPIAAIAVNDDGTTPVITASNDLRIRISTGFPMEWDASDLTATIGGSAAAKVSTTVAYEDGGLTLVLDVTADFTAGEDITVSDLSFQNFATAAVGQLELEVGNDDVVSAVDDKTVEIVDPVPAPGVTFTPADFALETGRPNPFRQRTTIVYDVPVRGFARLVIFDVSGRRVRTLVEGDVVPGRHDVIWDGRDAWGQRVASGVYFVRFESPEFRATRKVVRMR